MMIANVTSNQICFYNNFSLEIPVVYTTTNLIGFPFSSPIMAKVMTVVFLIKIDFCP